MKTKMQQLKTELSLQWNKPKKENLKKDESGNIIDKREPRDYKKIRQVHKKINALKS